MHQHIPTIENFKWKLSSTKVCKYGTFVVYIYFLDKHQSLNSHNKRSGHLSPILWGEEIFISEMNTWYGLNIGTLVTCPTSKIYTMV